MQCPEISIILPSINPDKWHSLFYQIKKSIGRYTFEVIVVGPNIPSNELLDLHGALNFRFIRDFGCPSRAFQIGTTLSEGKFLAWLPDDISLENGSLEQCLDFMQDKSYNHGMTLRYDEGGQNQSSNLNYWVGSSHGDQRLAGINFLWKIAPVFLYNRKYFTDIGGLDCSLEHINLNAHSVAYYTQATGGEIHLSPCRVFSAGWTAPTQATILYQAYLENDAPKFTEFWKSPDASSKYKVDFNNWTKSPTHWPRRYK